MRHVLTRLSTLVVSFGTLLTLGYAQEPVGSLNGIVADQKDAVIAKAHITASF